MGSPTQGCVPSSPRAPWTSLLEDEGAEGQLVRPAAQCTQRGWVCPKNRSPCSRVCVPGLASDDLTVDCTACWTCAFPSVSPHYEEVFLIFVGEKCYEALVGASQGPSVLLCFLRNCREC